jgi:hypothetical protein
MSANPFAGAWSGQIVLDYRHAAAVVVTAERERCAICFSIAEPGLGWRLDDVLA